MLIANECKRLRLLGGSSRFAQAQTTSCGSLKFMVRSLGGNGVSHTLRVGIS
ncbi:MAG: hypothetical protein J5743_12210 [Victivallales bacterium]|nr:hypothetical protein [Victivallales bacterium]